MTKFEKALLEGYMGKYSMCTLENIYYTYYDRSFDDHTPEYSRVIRSIAILAEQTRKES